MGRVAIVADSSACLPPELIEAHRIALVPLGLTIDGELYEDGSLSNGELFRAAGGLRGGAADGLGLSRRIPGRVRESVTPVLRLSSA